MKITQTTDYETIAKLNKYVHELHATLYPDYFKPYNFEKAKTFFQERIQKEEFIFLLVQDGDKPVGYAWIELQNHPENDFKKASQSVYVHHFCISEGQRKKGYGSVLMNEISAIAKAKGIKRMELDYWSDNESAKNFYKKNGFVTFREVVWKEL